ncbi:hypothetical protein BGLA2_420130 [Burkholderia gladioli]|nr:hypothetical protein BGLA2_420130 [Burkholderia gladioli]
MREPASAGRDRAAQSPNAARPPCVVPKARASLSSAQLSANPWAATCGPRPSLRGGSCRRGAGAPPSGRRSAAGRSRRDRPRAAARRAARACRTRPSWPPRCRCRDAARRSRSPRSRRAPWRCPAIPRRAASGTTKARNTLGHAAWSALAVALVRALHERIDEGVGDMAEHRADDLFEDHAGEFVVQRELDLAGIGAQRREAPVARELLERAVGELHVDPVRPLLSVAGREVLPDALEVDVDPRLHAGLVLAPDLDAAAPGQEVRVVGHVGHEVEHLFRRMADQYGFVDICHKSRGIKSGGRAGPTAPRFAKIAILNELANSFHEHHRQQKGILRLPHRGTLRSRARAGGMGGQGPARRPRPDQGRLCDRQERRDLPDRHPHQPASRGFDAHQARSGAHAQATAAP